MKMVLYLPEHVNSFQSADIGSASGFFLFFKKAGNET